VGYWVSSGIYDVLLMFTEYSR